MAKKKYDCNKYRKKKLHGMFIDDAVAHMFIEWCKERGYTMTEVLEKILKDFVSELKKS